MELRWSYDGATMELRWSYDGVTVGLRWSYGGNMAFFNLLAVGYGSCGASLERAVPVHGLLARRGAFLLHFALACSKVSP